MPNWKKTVTKWMHVLYSFQITTHVVVVHSYKTVTKKRLYIQQN